jgi:curved DNA-binding protein CbpA
MATMQKRAPPNTDAHLVLGVPLNASEAEIKQACRTLARRYHPDVSSDDCATARFIEIRAAYENLMRGLRARMMEHQRPGSSPDIQQRGYDVELEAFVSGAEARAGTTRSYYFHRPSGEQYTIEVEIPAGVYSGVRLCKKAAGGPSVDGTQRGDLYVHVVMRDPA